MCLGATFFTRSAARLGPPPSVHLSSLSSLTLSVRSSIHPSRALSSSQEASSTHGPFAALATSAGADEAAGPALLPPFIADPRLAAADYEALRPDASLRDVIMSYERALLPPNDDWNIMEDDENEDGYEDDDVDDDAEELEHVDAYVALLKVIRAAALIARVGGDVRKAEDLARFAGRAPCPTTLSMQLPAGKVNVSDARASSVELCAAKGEVRLLPIRPRSRGARRSLRTFPVVTLHPRFPFNV